MEAERRDAILAGLTADDTRTRATTAATVTQVDLSDLEVLDALLAVARDDRPLPDDLQPPEPEDPFAEFFGQSKQRSLKAVGEAACDRLVFTGVSGQPATVEHLAAALDADDVPEWLVKAVVKLLGETRWEDRLAAATALVPRLHAHDAPLYAVIVRFGEAEHRLMVASALTPYQSRAVNELLNHGASKPLMEQALGEGITEGNLTLDEPAAADALTLLVSWNSAWAGPVAQALHVHYPWALLVLGMTDPTKGEALGTWLESEPAAPVGLVRKLQEVLKASPPLPHFPLAAWLRYAGTGIEVVRLWKAGAACRPELERFVEAWEEAPDRAWDALVALAEANALENVGPFALAALERDDEQELWTRARIEALASADPPIDGLVAAVTTLLLRNPRHTRAFVPALMRTWSAEELRPLAEAYIALCESRPVIRKPSRPGLIHEEREGVDPVPLQPLVNSLDEGLQARLQDVLPYVRADEG